MSLVGWFLSETRKGFGPQEIVVSRNQLWSIKTVLVKVTTSGTGGPREIAVEALEVGLTNVVAQFISATQIQGLTRFHIFGAGLLPDQGNPAVHFAALPEVFLTAGEGFRVVDLNNIDPAGDEITIRVSAHVQTISGTA